MVAKSASAIVESANAIVETASTVAESASAVVETASTIVKIANMITKYANTIAETANVVAESASAVVEAANANFVATNEDRVTAIKPVDWMKKAVRRNHGGVHQTIRLSANPIACFDRLSQTGRGKPCQSKQALTLQAPGCWVSSVNKPCGPIDG